MDKYHESFTKRKKQEKTPADDPRWKRPDANLLHYMSKLKEQYLQRQTEYDQQAKRLQTEYEQQAKRGQPDYDQQAQRGQPDNDQQAQRGQPDSDQQAQRGQPDNDQQSQREQLDYDPRAKRGQPDYEQQTKRGQPDYDQRAKRGQPDYEQQAKRGQPDYDQQARRGQSDYDQQARRGQPDYDQHARRGQPDYDQQGKRVKMSDVVKEDAKDVKVNVHFNKAIEPIPSGLYHSLIEMSARLKRRSRDLSRASRDLRQPPRAVKHKSMIPVRSPPKRTAGSQNKEAGHQQKEAGHQQKEAGHQQKEATPASQVKERSHQDQADVKQEKPKGEGSYTIPQKHQSNSRLEKPEDAFKHGSSDNEVPTNIHRNRLSFASFKDNRTAAQRRNKSAPYGSPEPVASVRQITAEPNQIELTPLVASPRPQTGNVFEAGPREVGEKSTDNKTAIRDTRKDAFKNMKYTGMLKKSPSKKASPSRGATPLERNKVQTSVPRGSNREQKSVAPRASPKQKLVVDKPVQISRWSGVVVTDGMDKPLRPRQPIKSPVKLNAVRLRKPQGKLQRRDTMPAKPVAPAVKSESSPSRQPFSKQDPTRKKPSGTMAGLQNKVPSPQLKPKSASPQFDGVSNKELPSGHSQQTAVSAKTAPRALSPPQKNKVSPAGSVMSSSYNSRVSNDSIRSPLNSKKRVGSSASSAKGKPLSSMESAKQRLSAKQKLMHRSTSVPCNSLSPIASVEFQSGSDSQLPGKVISIKSISPIDKKHWSKSPVRKTPATSPEISSAKRARLRKDRLGRSLANQRKEKKIASFVSEFNDLAAGEQSSSCDRSKPSSRKDQMPVRHELTRPCSPSSKKKKYDVETVFKHGNQTRPIAYSPEKKLSPVEKPDVKARRKRELIERRHCSSPDRTRNVTAVQHHKEAHIPYGHKVRRHGHHCCRGVHLVHDGRKRRSNRGHRTRIFTSDRLRPKRCLHSCRLGKHGYKTNTKLVAHRMRMRPVSKLTHRGWNESDTDYSEIKHARRRRKYALHLGHAADDLTSDSCCYTYDFEPNSGEYSTDDTDTDSPYVFSDNGDVSELMDSTYSDCCEFEPRGSPPLKQRDAVQVTWNMSESNVPVHSSTYTALRRFPEKRVDSKYNPGARFRQNLCGERGVAKSKDPDRVTRQGSVPLKYKAPPRLQRHQTTLQSTQPGFTQRPTTDDQPREGQFNSDHFTASSSDLIEGDRVRKPETTSDGCQGGSRGNEVMDEIEAEMSDVLDSLFQSQYNIAIRVEALKEDLMRQVAKLQAPPKPVSFASEPTARPVAKWAGTYYDYIMMVGFMLVQFVFQFVIVKKY